MCTCYLKLGLSRLQKYDSFYFLNLKNKHIWVVVRTMFVILWLCWIEILCENVSVKWICQKFVKIQNIQHCCVCMACQTIFIQKLFKIETVDHYILKQQLLIGLSKWIGGWFANFLIGGNEILTDVHQHC